MTDLDLGDLERIEEDEYSYDMSQLVDVDSIVRFLRELGTPVLSLMKGVSLEEADKDPSVWIKVRGEDADGNTD